MANLVEEIVVGRTAIKVKFLRTVRVSSITNDKFILKKDDVAIVNPFRPIEVSEDYNGISRTLILYFSSVLQPNTTYKFSIDGLQDASGATIDSSGQEIEFRTGEITTPSSTDVVDDDDSPPIIDIDDHSVSDDGSSTDMGIAVDNAFTFSYSDFRIVDTDPSMHDPIVNKDYNNGRVIVKFSKYPNPLYVNSTYFKTQKKKIIGRGYVRWDPVTTQVALASGKPWVYVDFPSNDAVPVYNTAGKEYFETDYRYRLLVSKDVEPAATVAPGAGQVGFTVEQGTTFSRSVSYQNPNGTPRDLTGYTGQFSIRASTEQPPVLELTTDDGVIIEGPEGRVTFTLTASQTTGLAVGLYLYELDVSSADATPVVTRLLEGTMAVTA